MNTVLIDLSKITTKEALNAALREGLSFPDYYGGNLDALHDWKCLPYGWQTSSLMLLMMNKNVTCATMRLSSRRRK